jgi:hypothetical protein
MSDMTTTTQTNRVRRPADFDLDDLDDLDAVAARARELMAEHDYHSVMAANAQRDANDLVAMLDLAAAVRARRARPH